MITFDSVSIRAGAFALDDVSFTIPAGGYAILMGRTGSGKTTILESLCGLRTIAQGRILIQDRDVTKLKPAQRGVGYAPQDRALFSNMTVWEHLAFALNVRGIPTATIHARVLELADWLGITSLLYRKPGGLSGGEAQRVNLGRALSFEPEVLLLDEPLGALDQETKGEMIRLLRSIRARTRVTTLHVTHDPQEARLLADQVLVLQDGQVTTQTSRFRSIPKYYCSMRRFAFSIKKWKLR